MQGNCSCNSNSRVYRGKEQGGVGNGEVEIEVTVNRVHDLVRLPRAVIAVATVYQSNAYRIDFNIRGKVVQATMRLEELRRWKPRFVIAPSPTNNPVDASLSLSLLSIFELPYLR